MAEMAHRVSEARAPAAEALGPAGPGSRVIDIEPIRPLLASIVTSWTPVEIWLFGSRARGEANKWSDWDLFVVLPDDSQNALFDPLVAWRLRKDSGIRADIVLCRVSDFEEDRATHNTLAFEAATEGVRLYER